ncbi:Alpha/Beta hydrolase protein [Xylogone sp. PMI_703]|nr:Alpha/Beta hydrolase protein [Xylogone sp. PMI_703]
MDCCKFGSLASPAYQPKGDVQIIGGISTYITPATSSSLGVLVFLPDGFGLVPHNFILADMFADKGWQVVIPDYFEGDPITLLYLKRNGQMTEEERSLLENFDIKVWAQNHPHERVEKLLSQFLQKLPQTFPAAAKGIFGVGYCFGGKHVLRLASSAFVAGVAFHPSNVEMPDISGPKAPLFIGCAENDDMVSPTLASDLQTALEMSGNQFYIHIYSEMPHGFAARPDHEDSGIRKQFHIAFEDAVRFLDSITNIK